MTGHARSLTSDMVVPSRCLLWLKYDSCAAVGLGGSGEVVGSGAVLRRRGVGVRRWVLYSFDRGREDEKDVSRTCTVEVGRD